MEMNESKNNKKQKRNERKWKLKTQINNLLEKASKKGEKWYQEIFFRSQQNQKINFNSNVERYKIEMVIYIVDPIARA